MSFPRSWMGAARQISHWAPWRAVALDPSGLVVTVHEDSERTKHMRPCPSCEALVGENYLEACERAGATDADHLRAVRALREILAGDPRVFVFEYTATIDAEQRWHELALVPLAGMARCLVLHTDVTAYRKEERAHQDAELRYRTIVDSAPVAFVLIDRELRIVENNAEFLHLAGLPTDTVVQDKLVTDWLTPRDRERFARTIEGVLSTGKWTQFETECSSPDPDRKRVTLSTSRVLVDGEPHAAVFCLDLMNRTFAVESLRESEARYRAVVESQTELLCRFLPDTTLTFVNEAYCRFFGKTRDELVNQPFLALLPIESHVGVRDMVTRLMAEPTPQTCEHKAMAKDGQIRWLQWNVVPIRRADLTVEFQGTGRDVTERRLAEEALQQTRREVDDLAGRLIRAHEEECRHIAREMHDGFSQQLAALSIGLAVLARDVTGADRELQKRIEEFERDAMSIADGIRMFSHDLHPAVVDRLGLAVAVRQLVRQAGTRPGISFEADIDDRMPVLPHEMEYSIYRIAQETLGNIARHARAKRCSVALRVYHETLHLKIEDDGIGFDPKELEGSAALGLISIKERVRYMHGQLSIDSASGKGTVVKIEVPVPTTVAPR